MDGHHRVPSHPGEKGVRLYETRHRAPEQCLWLSGEPQELTVLRTSVQSHPTGTQQSLFSTFLHPTPNGYLLQLVLLQPFPLHLPPTSHSCLGLFHYLARSFLPNVPPPQCPTALTPPRPPPQTSCLLLSLHRTQHGSVLGCNGCSKNNEER